MGRFCLVAAALVAAAACGGKREVGSTAPTPARGLASFHLPSAVRPASTGSSRNPRRGADAGGAAEPDLESLRPRRPPNRTGASSSPARWPPISQQFGQPITGEKALADMPCGGWSGPQCSNLTLGIEIAKTCAPIVASFHRKQDRRHHGRARSRDLGPLGLARRLRLRLAHPTKKGPGYTYAGCLFSDCDPGNLKNGQVDGILYQVGAAVGITRGPACGPSCTLSGD